MQTDPMNNVHGCSPWQWCLDGQKARRLAAVPARRWLAVEQGRVWLTRSEQRLRPPEDLWLEAGDRLELPPGTEWVAEGWPAARVVVMQAP